MLVTTLFTVLLLGVAQAQENAGDVVASGLKPCYENINIFYKDNLPPASLNVALDLIRRIEDGLSKQNAREFSAEILHRYVKSIINIYLICLSKCTHTNSPVNLHIY